jgi:hypothetical protein
VVDDGLDKLGVHLIIYLVLLARMPNFVPIYKLKSFVFFQQFYCAKFLGALYFVTTHIYPTHFIEQHVDNGLV